MNVKHGILLKCFLNDRMFCFSKAYVYFLCWPLGYLLGDVIINIFRCNLGPIAYNFKKLQENFN